MFLLDSKVLAPLMLDALRSRDIEAEAAENVVQALVETSLRGVDSHGINLFPHYCRVVDSGRINRRPVIRPIRQDGATAVLDADHGFGHHASAVAVDLALELAERNGIGGVAVANSSHYGAAAVYALRAARRGAIAFSFTNADPLVKAAGGLQAGFGTNPVCFAAPMAKEDPLILDMATSLVSWNKIMNHRQADAPLPEGWAFDGEGRPVTDPHAARSLAPAGGYKGYGLGMMVEILCALLTGGPWGPDIKAMYQDLTAQRYISHFFMVLDIGRFTDRESFKERLQGMADVMRIRPCLDADSPVMVPGDPEKRAFAERTHKGIPMHPSKFDEYLAISEAFKATVIA